APSAKTTGRWACASAADRRHPFPAGRYGTKTRSVKGASTFRWHSHGCSSIRFLPLRQQYAETAADVSESPPASNTSTATNGASLWKRIHWLDTLLSGGRLQTSTRRPTKNGLPY